MYRPFKEHLNDAFAQWAGEHAPQFGAVKSLARGGGLTLRWRPRKDLAWFLVLQHTADRDRANVCAGWARGAWFADWAAAENHYIWLRTPQEREAFRAALRGEASSLPARLPEACFTADLLADPVAVDAPIAAEIEIAEADGAMGVPYELILARLREQPDLQRAVGVFLGEEITASLMAGNVPPFLPPNPAYRRTEPVRVSTRMLSWELWFEHVLKRAPSAQELIELCAPARAALLRQAGELLAKCREMAEA